jgi:hypothetical protein
MSIQHHAAQPVHPPPAPADPGRSVSRVSAIPPRRYLFQLVRLLAVSRLRIGKTWLQGHHGPIVPPFLLSWQSPHVQDLPEPLMANRIYTAAQRCAQLFLLADSVLPAAEPLTASRLTSGVRASLVPQKICPAQPAPGVPSIRG